MLLLAVAAMTTVSCSSDEDFEPKESNKGTITLIAGMPEVEGDTRTELGADGITPMWKANDKIQAITNRDEFEEQGVVTRFDFWGTNTSSAKTTTFKIDNGQSTNLQDFLGSSYFFAVHGDGYYSLKTDEQGKNPSIWMNLKSKQTPTNKQFDPSADMMVSKIVNIDSQRDYEKNPETLRFKRLTGILKLNIKPLDETHNGIKNTSITSLTMTTNNVNDDFAGGFDVNLSNGEITKRAKTGKGIEAFEIKNFKIGDGNSIYMCVLPTTIKQGSKLTVVLNNDPNFTKEINITKDIIIPGSTITTINLSFKDPNVVSPEPEPVDPDAPSIAGNVITMNKAGHLTKEQVTSAIAGDKLVISGDMNAKDFNALFNVIRGEINPIDLDLTDVNMIKSSYPEKTPVTKIYMNNQIPQSFFVGCKLKSILLPEAAEYLGSKAFQDITTLESATLGSNIINEESGEDIFLGCTGMKDLYVKAYAAEMMFSLSFYQRENRDVTKKVNVHISSSWDSEAYIVYSSDYWAVPTEGLWHGYTWASVTYDYE